MKSSYTSAGVNISNGETFVKQIKPLVKSTFSKGVLTGIGNFGAFYQFSNYKHNPVFVASTDSVGTKVKIAIECGKYDTVGEDIVNHCTNDIAVCGANPLFFLDYLAFGKLRSRIAIDIVKGLVRGCKKNNCSLIGGETAEMPGLYAEKDFDLAGTIVGVVEKAKIIDKKNVKSTDVLIGFPSSGLHTNGYSLARKVLLKKFKLSQYVSSLRTTLGDELLKVHRSYLRLIQNLIKRFEINSFSHITGGGVIGNTKRVVPENLKIKINWDSWRWNPIFKLIKEEGKISDTEMRNVFNLGIGLIAIVKKNETSRISAYLDRIKEKHHIIGEITK
ncbi:MAG TPA: phosphoribosylformylglycinamidine cyclo-ligase [Ignavibacteria bacterium]|jgi:phosphoribosylformylglycinamidine cyclo-ligase